MRRRVKRRLFMVSMAIATGASGSAIAKGVGNGYNDARPYSSGWGKPDMASILGQDLPDSATKPLTVFSKFAAILGNLNLRTESSAAIPEARNWRLELLPPGVQSGPVGDPRLVGGKRVGLALRMAF
jgi:hypothetical protein